MEFLNDIAAIASLFTVAFTSSNWVLNRKLNEEIHILVKHGDEEKYLPSQMKRRYCTRSEVQGLLRATRIEQNQYNIPYLSDVAFSQQLEKVQSGKPLFALIKSWLIRPFKQSESVHSLDQEYNTLYIIISDKEEYDQFKSR